ncbi:MAG: hypothetical protein HY922_03515 [Elusimicrobia bacterium]|nr:hypothetical protein [Elusimicrobiota bacterium]
MNALVWYVPMRRRLLLSAAFLVPLAAAPPACASDAASLQFTIPAPDPVQAGETLALQALAVNTGSSQWDGGSYYWVAEIYSLDREFLSRTEQVSPDEAVAPGGVAAISLRFNVPDTSVGRRLYRVFLVKSNQTLITSDYKPFQILEKPIPPTPEAIDYRIEGNVTVSFKDPSSDRWRRASGATTINTVGKIKDSSYLLNAYLLHQTGKAVDPYILLLNYYAPWGTIYAGDIAPTLSPLSVNGQSMRGLMFEQKRGRFFWTLGGGQTITSESGTLTTDGRYARTLYSAKAAYDVLRSLTASLNAFLGADEIGSLNTDPQGANYRGPNLQPKKNSGLGMNLIWTPAQKTSFQADYEKTAYQADTGKPGVSDTAWKGEFRMDRSLFKLRASILRAGPKYVSFGAPSVIGDRMTYDLSFGLFPVQSYSLSLSANQYRDNLAGSGSLTTTQRQAGMGHVFQFPTGTGLSVNGSMNTAKGRPSTSLDNQTTTIGIGLSQSVKAHSLSLGVQSSQFKDKNKLFHDLDTQTLMFSANLALPNSSAGALSISRSAVKDKFDGSNRANLSVSPSLSFPIRVRWTGQIWGTMTQSKNTSKSYPSDTTSMAFNSEYTYTRNRQNAMTLGLGYNKMSDKLSAANTYNEIVISMRYSYSF